VPVAMKDSPYTRAIVQMARAACGKPPALLRKTGWASSIFGLRRPESPVET